LLFFSLAEPSDLWILIAPEAFRRTGTAMYAASFVITDQRASIELMDQ